MNVLLDEVFIPFSPKLAAVVGTKEALFIQQLHYRLQISTNVKAGDKWVYNTYDDWTEEFPCWSAYTIQRIIRNLEASGMIISSTYNKMPMDKTKWYRINYEKLPLLSAQSGLIEQAKSTGGTKQNRLTDQAISVLAITKEVKKTTKKIYSENDLATIASVIEYLNEKASKRFKHTTNPTKKIVHARIQDGYTLEDFKSVIDSKTAQWLDDPKFCNFLRPSTLFKADKFENYLNEIPTETTASISLENYASQELDFGKGENPYEL